jgi:hypothetical protein
MADIDLYERAAMRYAADYDMPLERARDDVRRTFIGAQYALHEACRDLGRAVRKDLETQHSRLQRIFRSRR